MRAVLILCLAVVLAQARSDYAAMFQSYKAKYHRQYANEVEESKRFRIFAENMETASKLQASNPKATFGINQFADMSAAEFKVRHNSEAFFKKSKDSFVTKHMTASEKRAAAGQSINWNTKGAVTPIKNQGQCGSCWAFSTTGGIEGQWFLAGHTLTSVSEQQLVSCDTIDQGCNGGLMDNAFQWLLQSANGSLVTEASYPYVSGGGNVPACSMTGRKFGAQIDGFKNINHNEDDMAAFVFASGPLSIGVDATSWQTYTGGIMTNCQSTQVDHGVLIVGFDDNNNPPYWIVKNSWGESWGENGFIRVAKGTDQCLITSNPCTSEVKKAGPSPSPPTPPPSPSGKTFTQKTCLANTCTGECTSMTFDQNACITGASASYKAVCLTDGLAVTAFTTRNCTGASIVTVNPINTCSVVFRKTQDERFVENICTNVAPTPAPPAPPTPAPPVPPTPAPTFPSGWTNLFPPPYQNAPTIMMAISAVDETTSYVPGGENGSGFTTFEFNNQENGVFTPMQMPDMALMIMAIAVGGSASAPNGVVGGFGIGNGVQYFVNQTTVLPSTIPTLMVTTQDARMSRDGKMAIVLDSASNTVLFSADSGKTFNEKPLKFKTPINNCTELRYGALVDSKTYYVSLGSWPSNSNSDPSAFQVTEALSQKRGPDGKIKRTLVAPKFAPKIVGSSSSGGGNCNGYTAILAKTTDGGNTWTDPINLATDFYFNGIDCASATHCIAVGEGFNQNAGGHVYLTEDGTNWKQVFFEQSGSQGQYSFMSVRFSGKDGKEAWVGGSLMVSQTSSLGLFYHTVDGGRTWKQYPHGLPNLAAISTLDMLPSGVGFATAMTIFDDSTILRYDPSGPPPPGYFIQSQCPTATCNLLCQNVSFPQDFCLSLNGGGSAMASCTATAVVQKIFTSTDCTGAFNTTNQPLDQCLADNGSYFENYCPHSSSAMFRVQPPLGRKLRVAERKQW